DLIDAHRWLAIAYYDIGLMDETLRHLQRVAELDPRDPRPHRIMAVIHMDHGSNALAVEDFEESLGRDSRQLDRQEILEELSQAQIGLKRYEDALRTLDACEQTAKVLAMRADASYSLSNPADTRRLAQAALDSDSEQRLALLVMGKLALDDRRHEEAVKILSQAARVARADYDVQYTYYTALRAAGRTQDAEKQLAVTEELRQRHDEFNALVEDVVADPYNAQIRYHLGILAGQLDMPRIAQSWLKAAVALNPNHALARNELEKYDPALSGAAVLLRADAK
ncbi:MAG: tetratricopeptide repeat protein, partial [Pirellulales bacterium]